ncbi:MAG: hypothetical protein QW430_12740 [Metallosphaera sp.]|uniref:hypothetical protein n=1 Tax=Metallosphaera sp. TaxID=2020860 RepID=UPI00315FFE71
MYIILFILALVATLYVTGYLGSTQNLLIMMIVAFIGIVLLNQFQENKIMAKEVVA